MRCVMDIKKEDEYSELSKAIECAQLLEQNYMPHRKELIDKHADTIAKFFISMVKNIR